MKYLNDVDYKNCVGKIFKSTNSGCFVIKNYTDKYTVEIEFLITGYKTVCGMSDIRTGKVKDYQIPSVYGVGITGDKYSPTYKDVFGNRKIRPEYSIWRGLLNRCYNESSREKYPTYESCYVSENFKHYEYFYEWCNKQVGFGNTGWTLDKDLLIKGNKIYSEDTCVFLPQELNNLLVKNNKSRGQYPIGVSYHKTNKKFTATCGRGNSTVMTVGFFNTPEEAFYAYKKAKEDFIKEQALKWKDKIDPRAFQALMNYQVDIDD